MFWQLKTDWQLTDRLHGQFSRWKMRSNYQFCLRQNDSGQINLQFLCMTLIYYAGFFDFVWEFWNDTNQVTHLFRFPFYVKCNINSFHSKLNGFIFILRIQAKEKKEKKMMNACKLCATSLLCSIHAECTLHSAECIVHTNGPRE